MSSGMLSATTDFSRVCDVDFIAICVPSRWTSTSSLTSVMSGIPRLPLPSI